MRPNQRETNPGRPIEGDATSFGVDDCKVKPFSAACIAAPCAVMRWLLVGLRDSEVAGFVRYGELAVRTDQLKPIGDVVLLHDRNRFAGKRAYADHTTAFRVGRRAIPRDFRPRIGREDAAARMGNREQVVAGAVEAGGYQAADQKVLRHGVSRTLLLDCLLPRRKALGSGLRRNDASLGYLCKTQCTSIVSRRRIAQRSRPADLAAYSS